MNRIVYTLAIPFLALSVTANTTTVTPEFLQSIRTNLEQVLPDTLHGSRVLYLRGLQDGLSEVDSLPYEENVLQQNLPFFVTRNLIDQKGVATRETGTLAAYSVIRLLNYRSQVSPTLLSPEEAAPKIELIEEIEASVLETVQGYSLPQEERLLEEINRFLLREKRSITDPLYYNSPAKINAGHVPVVIQKFNTAVQEILDLSIPVERLKSTYAEIGLAGDSFDTHETSLHFRAITIPRLLVQIMFETISRTDIFISQVDKRAINRIREKYSSLDRMVEDQKHPFLNLKESDAVLQELTTRFTQMKGY